VIWAGDFGAGLGAKEPWLEYHIRTGKGFKERAAMKFLVTMDRDEDGVWIAECPSIPGCVSQGDTREEALANIQEAIALCLEVRAERGLPLTIETKQVEVVV
jgi:predicted RNase H-like HicB family nuclease